MQLILKQDVDNLGPAGELVNVKGGYGRNFLIPQGKAVMATKGAIKAWETERKQAIQKQEMDVTAAQEMADKLSETSITVAVKAGEGGQIFGSVTTQQVADALAEKGFDLDKRKIDLDENIKALGDYQATVTLTSNIKPKVKIWVVKEEA
ncbi:MAG: 50S ribosomal protein L9 [Balneolales bacterium]